MATKQVRLVGTVDATPSTVTVTAAAGSVGQQVAIPTQTTAITIVNTSLYGLEYRFGASPWTYLGKGIGVNLSSGIGPILFLRRINDGSVSVDVEVTVENVPVFGYNGTTVAPAFLGSNVCAMGDSIRFADASIVSGGLTTFARGEVNWMLSFLGHPWVFEVEDNVAEGGKTSKDVLEVQLPKILALHTTKKYTRCFISVGTNDTNTGALTVDQVKSNMMAVFTTLRGAGIIPVVDSIRPRGSDAAMTDAKRQNQQINQWLFVLSQTGMIEYLDVTEVYADNTTAFGNGIYALTYDGAAGQPTLHPNARGACLAGRVKADYYRARGVGVGLIFATSQADVFDRVNNPYGVAFNNANPLLQGATSVTAGSGPTGMTIASPAAGAWSKVNRTLSNGQVRSDPQAALSSAGTYSLYDDWAAAGAWSATQLQPGDIIEVRAKIVLAGVSNLSNLYIRLAENDGSGALAHFGLFSQDTTVALPLADDTIYLKSPRVTVRPYSGSGSAQMFARIEAIALAGATGTLTAQAFEVRKVN